MTCKLTGEVGDGKPGWHCTICTRVWYSGVTNRVVPAACCLVCQQAEADLLRQAIDAADSELELHQEMQAAGHAHGSAQQRLIDALQPYLAAAALHQQQQLGHNL